MTKKPVIVGRSTDEFVESYDAKTTALARIQDALKQLGEGWLYEREFMRLCKVGPIQFAALRPSFEGYFFEVRSNTTNMKRVWAGTKKYAAKLRSVLV